VHGRIFARDVALVIGPQARVTGDIRGARVTVHGEVHGSIWATERVDVSADAFIEGALSAPRVVLADGAILNGRVDIDRRTIAAAVARYNAEHALTT
jgi:cytoskeletal protein CcmA (bactofilin family)